MELGTGIPQYLVFQEMAAGRHENIARLVRAIEEAGYGYISVGDHIVHHGAVHFEREDSSKDIYGDVFSLLTYYAGLSKTLRLVISVLILPYRQPFQTAQSVATVDQISGGRVAFGVGPGYANLEFEAFGIPFEERGVMSDEYLDIIVALLSEEKVSFQGRYYQFRDVSLLLRPAQRPRPPIWIGGSGKRALERAIHRGDVWVPIASSARGGKRPIRAAVTPRELEEDLRYANERREELGKPPLGAMLSAVTGMRFTTRPADWPDDVRDRYIWGGSSAEELAEQINIYEEAGAQGITLGLPNLTVDGCLRDIEYIATKIMPLVG